MKKRINIRTYRHSLTSTCSYRTCLQLLVHEENGCYGEGGKLFVRHLFDKSERHFKKDLEKVRKEEDKAIQDALDRILAIVKVLPDSVERIVIYD